MTGIHELPFFCLPSANLELSVEGIVPVGITPGKHLVTSLREDPQRVLNGHEVDFSFWLGNKSVQIIGDNRVPLVAGGAVNTAYVLQSLGFKSPSLIIPIGDDRAGESIHASLSQDFNLFSFRVKRTAVTLSVRSHDGNTTLFCEKPPYSFTLDDLARMRSRLPDEAIMIFAGVKPQDLPMLHVFYETGDMIAFLRTYAFMPHASLLAHPQCREFIGRSHVVQMNVAEYQILTGCAFDPSDVKDIASWKSYGVTLITAGEDGAYLIYPDGNLIHQPAYNVRVVDTCGAGDAHLATFMYYAYRNIHDPLDILSGDTKYREEAALKMAAWVAAHTIQHVGPYFGIPDADSCENKWQEILEEMGE